MIRMFNNTTDRTSLTKHCALVAYIMLMSIGHSATMSAASAAVSPGALTSLIIGTEDLPWDVVLSDLKTGANVPRCTLEFFTGASKLTENWSGPPTSTTPGSRMTAHYCINIDFAVAASPEEATRIALKQVSSASVIIPEIAREKAQPLNADRVWFIDNAWAGNTPTGAGTVFVRDNVVCSVHITHKDGVNTKQLFTLASRLSEKIDAVAAGRPEPPPVLPPSMEEMKLDLEGAWDAKNIGKMLGKRAINIAIQHGKASPKAVPAARVAGKDYLVPLSHVASILGGNSKVRIQGGQARAVVLGKTVVFNAGKARVQVGGRTVKLDAATQINGRQAFVPLSFVEKALGKPITWGKSGKILLARI